MTQLFRFFSSYYYGGTIFLYVEGWHCMEDYEAGSSSQVGEILTTS